MSGSARTLMNRQRPAPYSFKVFQLNFSCLVPPKAKHPAAMFFTNLCTNGLRTPLGLYSPNPEFQWRHTESQTSADAQRKCTLRGSRSKTFNLDTREWESNTINTEEGQVNARYEGKPLESRTRYYWCYTNHRRVKERALAPVLKILSL